VNWFRVAGAPLAALSLYACATPAVVTRTAPSARVPSVLPAPSARVTAPSQAEGAPSFADLPGWNAEDHAAALRAFVAGCGVSRDADLRAVCARARSLGPLDETHARHFLDLLTAYFAPCYEARESREDPFIAPVLAKPTDSASAQDMLDAAIAGRKLPDPTTDSGPTTYPDRAEIETAPPDHVLAWMKPEELFFLQIQGSGVLVLPDGRRMKAVFSASNGKPFIPIARILRDRGLLADNNTSGDAIMAWLAEHRGPEADEVMRQNPRYIFFNLEPDDGREPAGAAGGHQVPRPPPAGGPAPYAQGGRDGSEARAPVLSGAFPVYQRLAVALDSGGAIKGAVRADLYAGSGPGAGREAGRIRHVLTLYRLAPIPAPTP